MFVSSAGGIRAAQPVECSRVSGRKTKGGRYLSGTLRDSSSREEKHMDPYQGGIEAWVRLARSTN